MMTEVSEFMKKTLSFGLGVAALTGDKVKQFVDEAVQRGEMSREEAHKFMDEVSTRADEERKSMQAWIREQVNKMLVAGGAASIDRVTQLEARLEGLERRFAALLPAAPEEAEPITPEEGPPTVETT
jgi:polyhydroxyalkanoate synthesis regulator phasin